MKKFAFLMVSALVFCGSLNAQDKEIKHEIAVSFGGMSNSNWIDAFENIGGALAGARFDGEKFVGPFSAEYFYHLDKKVSLGGIFCYGQLKEDVYMNGRKNPKDGKSTNGYFTVMPAVKFDWYTNKYIGLYTKVGAGVTFRSEEIKFDDNSRYKDISESEVHFNWQLSLIGLEAGGRNLRGFVELGVGEQGMGQVGLRCKF